MQEGMTAPFESAPDQDFMKCHHKNLQGHRRSGCSQKRLTKLKRWADMCDAFVSTLITKSVVAIEAKNHQRLLKMASELMDRKLEHFLLRDRQKTRGSLKTLLEITKTNNRTKGKTQAGLLLQGMMTRNRIKGLNLYVPIVTSTITVLVYQHALTARSLATCQGLKEPSSTANHNNNNRNNNNNINRNNKLTTTTATTTTQEPKVQIPMPSFALSVGLQATSRRTAPSGRTRTKEMATL
ncbi:hypothetical protein Tco_0396122 [Tanacetum coccineum]